MQSCLFTRARNDSPNPHYVQGITSTTGLIHLHMEVRSTHSCRSQPHGVDTTSTQSMSFMVGCSLIPLTTHACFDGPQSAAALVLAAISDKLTMQLKQYRCPGRVVSRAHTVRVVAKVQKSADAARVVRGTCFVTKDVSTRASRGGVVVYYVAKSHKLFAQNIDTDQIIPAEYLTLVPSKVCCCCGCWSGGCHDVCMRGHVDGNQSSGNFISSADVTIISIAGSKPVQ